MSAAQWAAARATFSSNIYPSGLPSTGVDSTSPNWTQYAAPQGCSHITQYTITQPGGRVCTEPQHQYLCYPIAAPVGKLLVWLCGHVPMQGYEYMATDGSSPVVEVLKLGWHVLVILMPSFDWNIVGGSAAQHITIGGVLTSVVEHSYQPLDQDSGPSAARMFTDQVLRATTQAFVEVSPSKLVLAGHSGGGCYCPWVGAIDSRFVALYDFEGFVALGQGWSGGAASDYEQYTAGNPIYTTSPYCIDDWGVFGLATSIPGRRSGYAAAISDEYFPIPNQTLWHEQIEAINDFVASTGASVTGYLEASGHDMTAARVNWMLADIASHGI